MGYTQKDIANAKIKRLFSKRLKALMEEHGIQQNELAKILGVSESTVGKWILLKSIPRMGIIQKLADYFGVGKSYLLEEKAEKTDFISSGFTVHMPDDAMSGARILAGDLLLIQNQEKIENGMMALVRWKQNTLIRHIYKIDNYILLQAENQNSAPLLISENDLSQIKILGKVIAFQSFLK